ncbi:hypothetical protein ABEZ21_23960 [Brevibacillus porteri]|uniref:Uncharacterized protein n=1 Tax=Brevibacillus porteri TaxID=2126350 RepID=A0ABX5FFP0_9BACL|nr:hypothetical protein [Brevibacillus porteri]MED1803063.1 hypothetical protein [Brevibacillus porteri]MED2135329.1 hypothetical protein [Brevibacillus porteri]MED2748763.1 hypothetical protein [Brevibacillus porteri]MED4899573.1 hypothetical protein [Brevibacillus porteri]PSK01174.1 hypothetical protein C7R92_31740 [Brevibacillus porteri]
MNRESIVLKLTNNTYHITFNEDGTATAITEKNKNGIAGYIKFTNCPEGHKRTVEAAKALYVRG